MKKDYIKRKAKLTTAIAACAATIIFGASIGFGGSQLLVEAMRVADGYGQNSPRVSPNIPDDIDRVNVPDVLKPGGSDSNGETSGSSNISSVRPGEEMNAEELYAKLSDTVVGIKITQRGSSELTDIIGSGVIISEDGFIITCAHVIDDAEKVFVVVDDYDDPNAKPHEYEAMVYGFDSPSDLAVIKITNEDKKFKYAEIGRSSELRTGQTVVAIGNPLGLVKTMTQGIISGLQRDLNDNPYMLPSIQTDAALNPGNSGCPLFNMRGEIVGIVNIKLVYGTQLDNLGFAISIDEAMPIISELTQHGAVTTRAMLGITGREYSWEIQGFLVETIRQGTPAAKSGLARGDIITAINGTTVAVASDIQNILKDLSIGDEVTVRVVRHNNYGDAQNMEFKFELTRAEQ